MSAGLVLANVDAPPLAGVNLTVPAGACVCLTGLSGSGKSRLLRAVVDLDPAGGVFRLDGTARETLPPEEWRRRIMLVPADSAWWTDHVIDHLPRRPDPAVLERLQLADVDLDADPAGLSSGERQRFALLRAVMRAPQFLLLDEPTANLDAANVARVEQWLLDLCRAGTGLLWVSHDAAQVARVADRVVAVRDGSVRAAS